MLADREPIPECGTFGKCLCTKPQLEPSLPRETIYMKFLGGHDSCSSTMSQFIVTEALRYERWIKPNLLEQAPAIGIGYPS